MISGPEPSLYQQRWLLFQFVRREIGSRYAGSAAGLGWALLHPVIQLVIFGLVFEAIFKVKLPPSMPYPYLVFVGVVLWPWVAFQEGIVRGSQAVVANAALVKKVPFSHELLVYAAVLSSFLVQMVGYITALLILALWGHPLHWLTIPSVFIGLILLLVLTTGLALAICAVQVFVRDVDQVIGHGLSLVFYLTPVLFSITMVPGWVASAMRLNPLALYIDPLRAALLNGTVITATELLSVSLVSCSVFWLGRQLFLRVAPHFEDVL